MASERAWAAAQRQHETALAEFLDVVGGALPDRWRVPYAEGKWSPAEEALHVALAYELGISAADGGESMRLRVSRPVATLSRWFILPVVLRTGRFPGGAVAPHEVRPSRDEALTLSAEALSSRISSRALATVHQLREADRRNPALRVTHAYFGPLRPLATLRLLSAHTLHHARRLAARSLSAASPRASATPRPTT